LDPVIEEHASTVTMGFATNGLTFPRKAERRPAGRGEGGPGKLQPEITANPPMTARAVLAPRSPPRPGQAGLLARRSIAFANGILDQVRGLMHVEFVHQVGAVMLDSAHADKE
jgi:hypothetical protein